MTKHLDAAYKAMGLSPASSRPLSCCITELKEQLAESQRQLAAVAEKHNLLITDTCLDDTNIRKLCQPFLTELECEGDRNGVPNISDVVELITKQLVTVTSERDKLQYEIDMAANRSRETINHLAAQLAAVTAAIEMAKGCCLSEAKSCGCLIGLNEALKGKG